MRKLTFGFLAFLIFPMLSQAGSRPCPCKYSFEEGSEKRVLLLSYNRGGRSFCSIQQCFFEPITSAYICEDGSTWMIPSADGSIKKQYPNLNNKLETIDCEQDDEYIKRRTSP